jgi:hypothetical protein
MSINLALPYICTLSLGVVEACCCWPITNTDLFALGIVVDAVPNSMGHAVVEVAKAKRGFVNQSVAAEIEKPAQGVDDPTDSARPEFLMFIADGELVAHVRADDVAISRPVDIVRNVQISEVTDPSVRASCGRDDDEMVNAQGKVVVPIPTRVY